MLDSLERRGDPLPPPHDVQAGGYAQSRYQRRKLEETSTRPTSPRGARLRDRSAPTTWCCGHGGEPLAFSEQLPDSVLQRGCTGAMWVDANPSEVVRSRAALQGEARPALRGGGQVRDRVVHDYMDTAGFQGTLSALRRGGGHAAAGARHIATGALRPCGFRVRARDATCPTTAPPRCRTGRGGGMVRMAEGQGSPGLRRPREGGDMKGAGACSATTPSVRLTRERGDIVSASRCLTGDGTASTLTHPPNKRVPRPRRP